MTCPVCKVDGAMTVNGKCAVCGFPLRFDIDAGPLELGFERDSELDRRNDMHMFMEEWIGSAGFRKIGLLDGIVEGSTCGPIECPPEEEIELSFMSDQPEPGAFAAEVEQFYGGDGSHIPPPIIAVFRTEEEHENFAYTITGEPILRVGGRCDDGSHAGTEMCAFAIEELWAAGKTAPGDTLLLATGNPDVSLLATVGEPIRCDSEEAQAFQVLPGHEWCHPVTLSAVRS